MNPEIELVKKWLADPESVSAEELKRAADEDAANIAVDAKYWVNHVKYWVKRYEELTK